MPTALQLRYRPASAATAPSNTPAFVAADEVARVAAATGIREMLMAAMYPTIDGLGFALTVSQN